MNRSERKAAARQERQAALIALKTSQAREYTVRLVFKRPKRRGARTVPSVFLTRTGEMPKVPEARRAAEMRANVTISTGKMANGEPAGLTFAEAWGLAFGLANSVGADTVSALGARYATASKARVA